MINIKSLMRLLAVALAVMPGTVFADELNSGDTAWTITATVLVLFMTIPGLSLFYAGMVRSKNVLSVLMQCFAITSLMSILWAVYGYSLAFDGGGSMNALVGGLSKAFLAGITADSLWGTIPESVFMIFQMFQERLQTSKTTTFWRLKQTICCQNVVPVGTVF